MWEAFLYLAQVAALFVRIRAAGFRGVVRTLVIVEDPTQPLELARAQELLAPTGALVIPGFRVVV